ncbi:MAG TPA: XrtA/PEP-CTERM system TPR-repeat protein PrsT [Thiohalobacter sp.]|nr:XrtA/PEP-CTERM system TPR-repeat protein PrsT [Thiohalobacter sp.]
MIGIGRLLRAAPLMLASCVLALTLAACGFDSRTPEEIRLEAKSRIAEYDYKTAEIHLKNLLRANPDDIEARWLLADAYMQQWKLDAAYKELEKALELGMAPAAVYPRLARAYYSAPSHQRLLALEPGGLGREVSAQVLAYKSLAALQAGDDRQAQSYLQQAESLAPELGDVQLAGIMYRLGQGDRETARERLDALQPGDPYLQALVGRLYLRLQALAQAKRHLLAAVDAGARFYNVYIDLALIAMADSEREAAVANLRQLKAIAPRHPAVDYIEGLLLFTEADYPPALSHFERVVSTYDAFIPAHMYLGLTHYALGNDQQASTHIERFVSAMHSFYPLDKIRAHIYFRLGDYPRAIELLQGLRQIRPDDPSVLTLLGETYLRAGDMARVREVVDALLDQDPDNVAYRMNLGMLLLDSGQSEAGLAEIDRVVERAAEPLEIRKLVALKLIDRGEVDKAGALVESVLAESPDNADFRELRALIHASRGESEQAEDAFLAAIEADPDDIGALGNLAVFYMRRGDLEDAESCYRRILAIEPEEARANLGLARIMAQRGEIEAAETHIERALHDNDPRTRVSAANIYTLLGRYDKAVSLLHSETSGAVAGQAGLALARAYLEQGNFPSADYALGGLPASVQGSPEYLQLRARTSLALGQPQPAAAAAQRILERDERNFTALMVRAQAALLEGRVEAAAATVARLEQFYPDSREARMFAGVLESVRGNEEGSIQYFEALYQQLRLPRIAILLSDKYLRTGAADRAEAVLDDWLKQEGEDLEVMAALGRVYIQTGAYVRARELYQRLLDRAPDHVAALNNYAMLIAEERPGEALRHAKKAYLMQRNNPAVKDTYNRMLELNGRAPVE